MTTSNRNQYATRIICFSSTVVHNSAVGLEWMHVPQMTMELKLSIGEGQNRVQRHSNRSKDCLSVERHAASTRRFLQRFRGGLLTADSQRGCGKLQSIHFLRRRVEHVGGDTKTGTEAFHAQKICHLYLRHLQMTLNTSASKFCDVVHKAEYN